jgi:hypothetical protein
MDKGKDISKGALLVKGKYRYPSISSFKINDAN